MKLVEFHLSQTPPLQIMEMNELTEVVVVAGPNGVGKTRAIAALLEHFQNPTQSNIRIKVSATSDAERQLWKGLQTLDTADADQAQVLRTFLRRPDLLYRLSSRAQAR